MEHLPRAKEAVAGTGAPDSAVEPSSQVPRQIASWQHARVPTYSTQDCGQGGQSGQALLTWGKAHQGTHLNIWGSKLHAKE